jgi:hypothetical protein
MQVKINEEVIVVVMDYYKLLTSVSELRERVQIPNIIFCFRHKGLKDYPGWQACQVIVCS